jgi:hypothetical protein
MSSKKHDQSDRLDENCQYHFVVIERSLTFKDRGFIMVLARCTFCWTACEDGSGDEHMAIPIAGMGIDRHCPDFPAAREHWDFVWIDLDDRLLGRNLWYETVVIFVRVVCENNRKVIESDMAELVRALGVSGRSPIGGTK